MNLSQQGKLMMLGMCQLKCRCMSAQEAAYRICDVDMIYSNRQVKRISTLKPEKRMKRLNTDKLAMKREDEGASTNFAIDDCFDDNIIDVYRKRPVVLEKLTLFQFASWYEKRPLERNPKFVLLDSSGSLHKRRRAMCLRTSNLSMNTDDYYYSLLLLHLPHREEKELILEFPTAQEAFLSKENQLNKGELKSEQAMNELVATTQRLRTSLAILQQLGESNDGANNDDEESLASDYDAYEQDELDCSVIPAPEPVRWTNDEERQWQSLTVGEISPNDFRKKLSSLMNDQKRVLKYLHWKLNPNSGEKSQIMLFLTGNAGTGKSWLLEVIVEWLRETKASFAGHDPVVVAAPTGLAAKNIGGVTLHSLLKLPVQHQGCGLDQLKLHSLTLQRMKKSLMDKKFLIVDEVSMLGEKMLLFANDRLQEVFDNENPFGGINVIFCGDFFQLPPVKDRFCFHCHLFEDFDILLLEENKRQADDKAWCKMLDKIRIGSALTSAELQKLNRKVSCTEDLADVETDMRLYPTRRQVQQHNEAEQEKLLASDDINDFEEVVCAEDIYSINDSASGCTVEPHDVPQDDSDAGGLQKELRLAVNSHIMCIKNLGDGIVNGSMGKVHSFELSETAEVTAVFVLFEDRSSGSLFQDPNRDNAVRIEKYCQDFRYMGRSINRVQFPLIPAWAVTIHKAQGMSLNSAVVSIGSKIFQHGQIYVALSRVRKLDGLYIEDGFSLSKWWQPTQAVLDFYLKARVKHTDLKKQLKNYRVKSYI